MLPEAVEHSENALQFAFLGILLFWFVEKFIHWHHCGKTECQIHSSNRIRPVGYLNLIGDGIHNLIDGAVIMAAYLSSIPLGITATLAIVAHEIPQEIGDFAVLLHSGMKRKQALLLNFGSALLAIVGAFLAYFAIEAFENLEPLLLGFAAGGFIYIALTDLMPELHRECNRSRQVSATLALLAGIGLIYLSIQLLPHA